MAARDPVELASALIRAPSVTPADAGALDVVQAELEMLGFACHRLSFGSPPEGPIENLYARFGTQGRNFCFAGHTDVVPPGDLNDWASNPFEPVIRNGFLYGRGAADMKSAIAAFMVAVRSFLQARPGFAESISLLITGDEEGPAKYGTVSVLDWLEAKGEKLDHCLVGEPTSAVQLGDMVKIGRRGSLNAHITVNGIQGHVAYPDRADNPITKLVKILDALKARTLDTGNAHFQPSNLEITTVDVGNPTENLIPGAARARLNIRFNTEHSGATLSQWIHDTVQSIAPASDVAIRISGEAFMTPPGVLSALLAEAIRTETGRAPELSTTGGTSDARFIQRHCPVIEFGLVGATMHKVDEQASVADIHALARIYAHVLNGYFAA
jgi:succinyl-diaminopimelate desuccinylase